MIGKKLRKERKKERKKVPEWNKKERKTKIE